MIEPIRPAQVPPPGGPYTPGVKVGDLVFLAGQGPFDASGARVGETFAEQVHQVLRNLEAVAAAAGTSLRYAVKVNAYLSTLNLFAEFNEVIAQYMGDPAPARTTVPVDLRGFDVEIDAICYVPPAG